MSSDGAAIISVSFDKTIKIWSTLSYEILSSINCNNKDPMNQIILIYYKVIVE